VGASAARSDYGRGARVLSIGIAATGLVTFAYFSVASHVLGREEYGRVGTLWAVAFVIVSVIYRPIEQLLSRTIAQRRARGLERTHPLRTPLLIQLGFALGFLAVALALRERVRDGVFDGSEALYWVLVGAVLSYAASYFARGWLAGHQRFGLYGALVLLESTSRVLFPVAVAVGIAQGQSAVALGILAAPLVSLVVVPWAFRRRTPASPQAPLAHPTPADADAALAGPATETVEEASADLSLRRGGRFAIAVFFVMLAEQTLLNAAVLTVNATAGDRALAGYVFNVLLITRAPLQLFQAIQTSLLPHLSALATSAAGVEFARAIRVTLLAIAAFAGAVALGLLALGPEVMELFFDEGPDYDRLGLAAVAIGMGLHLASGTLNQAALARDQAGTAALAWTVAAVAFVVWLTLPVVDDQLLRVELGYLGATAVLALMLGALHRRPAGVHPQR
jgi:O-antigen/teichoic acid export membrane protein